MVYRQQNGVYSSIWFSSSNNGCFKYEHYESVGVTQSDGLWEGTIQVSACFGMKCSVALTSGEELEQVVCSMSVKVLRL